MHPAVNQSRVPQHHRSFIAAMVGIAHSATTLNHPQQHSRGKAENLNPSTNNSTPSPKNSPKIPCQPPPSPDQSATIKESITSGIASHGKTPPSTCYTGSTNQQRPCPPARAFPVQNQDFTANPNQYKTLPFKSNPNPIVLKTLTKKHPGGGIPPQPPRSPHEPTISHPCPRLPAHLHHPPRRPAHQPLTSPPLYPATGHQLALLAIRPRRSPVPHLRRHRLGHRHPPSRLVHRRLHRRPRRPHQPLRIRRRLLPHRHRLVPPHPRPPHARPQPTHLHCLRRRHGQLRRLLQRPTPRPSPLRLHLLPLRPHPLPPPRSQHPRRALRHQPATRLPLVPRRRH